MEPGQFPNIPSHISCGHPQFRRPILGSPPQAPPGLPAAWASGEDRGSPVSSRTRLLGAPLPLGLVASFANTEAEALRPIVEAIERGMDQDPITV